MRITFRQSIAGGFWHFAPGDVGDLPDDEALRLVRAGIAEPVKDPDPVETATLAEPVETPEASPPQRRTRRRGA